MVEVVDVVGGIDVEVDVDDVDEVVVVVTVVDVVVDGGVPPGNVTRAAAR